MMLADSVLQHVRSLQNETQSEEHVQVVTRRKARSSQPLSDRGSSRKRKPAPVREVVEDDDVEDVPSPQKQRRSARKGKSTPKLTKAAQLRAKKKAQRDKRLAQRVDILTDSAQKSQHKAQEKKQLRVERDSARAQKSRVTTPSSRAASSRAEAQKKQQIRDQPRGLSVKKTSSRELSSAQKKKQLKEQRAEEARLRMEARVIKLKRDSRKKRERQQQEDEHEEDDAVEPVEPVYYDEDELEVNDDVDPSRVIEPEYYDDDDLEANDEVTLSSDIEPESDNEFEEPVPHRRVVPGRVSRVVQYRRDDVSRPAPHEHQAPPARPQAPPADRKSVV